MGRPIKEARMGSGSGKIEVTAAFATGTTQPDGSGAETASSANGQFLVNQRGSRKFKVTFTSSDGSTTLTQVLLLKPKAPDQLANGEFCVQVILSDSTVAYVEKFYNRTIHYVETDGVTTGRVKYTLGSEGTDEGAVANLGSIDVQ